MRRRSADLQSMLYPDGETVVNGYDSGGKLIEIDGTKAGWDYSYLKEMGYDKFGQRTYMRLGNNTETSYSYAADTRRLSGLNSLSQQTGRTFQSLTYGYDANGNQTGWEADNNNNRREIIWDEENRIQSTIDNGKATTYKYNDAGERVLKIGAQGETVYVNQFYIIRGGSTARKHYFAGASRVASKVADKPAAPGEVFENDEHIQYFYHADHLGSASYVTDALGLVSQHVQYYPFGETWVEEHSNRQRTPFLFTGKELDEETGLYYFGDPWWVQRVCLSVTGQAKR